MLQTMYFNPKEFVASLSYYFGKDYGYLALLFRHDTQTKEVQVKRSEILAGFQYSIINNDCCYSLSGDTLYIAEKGFGYSNVGISILLNLYLTKKQYTPIEIIKASL